MTSFIKNSTQLLTAAIAFALLLPAAQDKGCGKDEVIIGDDGGDGGDGGDVSTTSGGGNTAGSGGGTACYIGGCSGQLCSDVPDAASTCEWLDEYLCYQLFGVCEADTEGACGWVQSQALLDCIAEKQEERTPVEEACVRDNDDACETDADCQSGGCGGELCYNPAVSEGASTCDCTAPSYGCGCVDGTCSWYQ